ncbi:hypothetical protein J437_LFUL006793 [Ladona fulva]|uniref:Peptidase S1 domain-containing protein n=1 Tax=Ladona fulva TaxID=123851 RepID=A0A8K0JU82_LADFU|nr:hypothetical protein J437_LFUL006793 [Ladona fulva]
MHGANEDNNLAILKMVRPVIFEEYPHIAPVCLPMFMNSKANLSDCMVAGWSSSKVVTLIEFLETYMDYVDPEHRGVKSLLLSSSCPKDKHGRNCNIHHHSQHKSAESSPIEIMLQEVDEISAQIKVKLEENTETDEEEKIYSEKPVIYSRVLQKSVAQVLSHSECSKLVKDLNATSPKPSQICVLPQESSQPCVGDVGSPVICKLVEEKKKSLKEGSIEDIAPKYAVVGIITQSYSCNDMDQKTSTQYPLLASSISKSLDHICYAITSSFKKTKIGSFKIQSLRQL